MSRRSDMLVGVLVVAAGILVGAVPERPLLQYWEIGGAQVELGRVKMLAERLSKQNLLYQLELGEQRKSDLAETVSEMDAALRRLVEGSPLIGVPIPPSTEIRAQIERIDEAWGPLRTMALASPYDYMRRSATERASRIGDRLLVRHFDDLTEKLVQRADQAQELYKKICRKQEMPDCDAMVIGPGISVLSERIVKEATFVHAKIDPDQNTERLTKTRAALARAIDEPNQVPIVRQARSHERGTPGKVVDGMRRDIEEYWDTLRAEVDQVLEGRPEEFDVRKALHVQELLVWEHQRYTIAIIRFGAEQRARQSTSAPN